MKLVVDGLIFQKEPFGGVARLFREILPRMCDLEPELHVRLFIDGPLSSELPQHAHIQVQHAPAVRPTVRLTGWRRQVLYPFRRAASRAWQWGRSLWLGRGAGALWHSTYYTSPQVWDGAQVVTVYDLNHERYRDIYNDPLDEVARQQMRRCVALAGRVICISEATRRDVEQIYQVEAARLRVVPIACSPVFRRLKPDPPPAGWPTQPFLLYVGRRGCYKNFRWFVDAYSRWSQNQQVGLAVTGTPWSREERLYLKQLELADRVFHLGILDDEGLCQAYNQATALVFPSLNEGFGIPVLEALSCACPVVASRIPSTLEVAGDCPFYFESGQPHTLYEALEHALAEGRRPERVQRGLDQTGLFSWERTARQTLEVYRELIPPRDG